MLIKETVASAKICWCPVINHRITNILAIGSCGINSNLNIGLFDISSNDKDIPIIGSTEMSSRCTSIAWGNQTGNSNMGIICIGMENGYLDFFRPIISESEDIDLYCNLNNLSNVKVHESSVTCLNFNNVDKHLLGSGCSDGKVYVTDLNNETGDSINSYEPGRDNKHGDTELTALRWNQKVPHIMASSSTNGLTVIWDLKLRKSAITFRDPAQRHRPSTLAWVPQQPTQIVVGYDDDRNPSLQLWDLRNVSYPFKEAIVGHQKGILSVDFSSLDPNLLLSSGKDGKTICWTFLNNQQPEIYSEMYSQQWNVQNIWSPYTPGIYATASHNDRVGIYSLSHSHIITYVPSWYRRPTGVNFAFSGKMVTFSNLSNNINPKCNLYVVPSNPEIIPHADIFDQLLSQGNYIGYCRKKASEVDNNNEKLAWNLVENMFTDDSAEKRLYIASLLGFDSNNANYNASQFLGRKPGINKGEGLQVEINNFNSGLKSEYSGTSTFGNSSTSYDPQNFMTSQCLDPEKFFQQLGEKTDINGDSNNEEQYIQEKVNEQYQFDHEYNTPSNIFGNSTNISANTSGNRLNSVREREWSKCEENVIKDLFITGNIEAAIDVCVTCGFFSEALLMAIRIGGPSLEYVRRQYIKKHDLAYLQKCFGYVMFDDLEDFVKTSNLDYWSEVLAIIAIYTHPESMQSNPLCTSSEQSKYCMEYLSELLAKRLQDEKFDVRSALICYLCARNFRNSIEIWGNMTTSGQSSLILGLQDFVEKVAILQSATRFNGNDENITKQVVHYAEILANSGRITAAMKFLSTLAANDTSINSAMLRDRIYNAAPEVMKSLGFSQPPFPYTLIDIFPNNIQQRQYITTQNVQQFGRNIQNNMNVYQAPSGVLSQISPQMSHRPSSAIAPSPTIIPSQPSGISSILSSTSQTGTILPNQQSHQYINSNLSSIMPPSIGSMSSGAPTPMARPSSSITPGNIINKSIPPPPPPNNTLTRPNSPASYGGQIPGSTTLPSVSIPQIPSISTIPQIPSIPSQNSLSYISNQGQSIQNPIQVGQQSLQQKFGFSQQSLQNSQMSRPSLTTAPHSGATPPIPGMPIPWPLPTATQQLNSNTSSTASINRQIQAATKRSPNIQSSQPLPPQLLDLVMSTINKSLLEAFVNEPRKQADAQKRFDELFDKLKTGNITDHVSNQVVKLCQAMQSGDFVAAHKIHIDLSSSEWEHNKNWLMAFKRILPK
ncbi:uncharacterized protein CMU_012370 [Cryptosporidium muris RN66]|uniref:Uncharacterized protein n=1 Tax=Cryptosporidium muris (strain RN66) TaxID=441375 RepID=B6AEE6_CRYMR|nr:uncharacterized protein CMU_012370 [Cryptosporidium muris RN66]EEA06563.1 hypothetical protein, conserved [Cryptosporidium muris RN66]|eukprot:XP_002140912.1 hypothetical protein [Cryptosporidium muris RN66]